MHLNTWNEFRYAVYGCFLQGKDALFNLLDALLSECEAKSLIELSLSPLFERTWASVYEALTDGKIDEQRLRALFLEYLARPTGDQPLRIGIDASNIARPKAVTSEGRSRQKVPNLPDGEQAITYGWQFSTMVA
jgi:DDE superfamily endonuclease